MVTFCDWPAAVTLRGAVMVDQPLTLNFTVKLPLFPVRLSVLLVMEPFCVLVPSFTVPPAE